MKIISFNFKSLITCVALYLLLCGGSFSATVVLRIRSGNPIDKPQKVRVRTKLPDRIATNNIIDSGGLSIGYDVKGDALYVYNEVELGPKEIKIYDVVLEDIWVVSEDELRRMVSGTGKLVEMLKETDYYKTALMLQSDISRSVDDILAYQEENSISAGVTPVQHIRAYETNLRMANQVKKDVGRVENLVLASGQDPGDLVGVAQDTPKPRKIRMQAEDYKEVVFQITVKNSSPSEVRNIDIKRDLPSEIQADDVLDAGDLSVGRDSKRNITYVFKKNVKLAPNQSISYEVKIRDKWNINSPRFVALQARVNDIVGQIGEKDQYKSIDDNLKGLLSRINAIRDEAGPEELGSEYVAFYRNQSRKLDSIEQDIYRIEAALRPVDKKAKRGFRVQPPSLKTTWLVIWVILAFLGIISLLFFFRWMGKSKAEKME
jgi:hypothetical protein